MVEICEKQKCVGCGVCYNKCNKNAITMVENEEGFKYPVIDNKKCVDCGICTKICPINNDFEVKNPLKYLQLKIKIMKVGLKAVQEVFSL